MGFCDGGDFFDFGEGWDYLWDEVFVFTAINIVAIYIWIIYMTIRITKVPSPDRVFLYDQTYNKIALKSHMAKI